jgi:hypothetical protein
MSQFSSSVVSRLSTSVVAHLEAEGDETKRSAREIWNSGDFQADEVFKAGPTANITVT